MAELERSVYACLRMTRDMTIMMAEPASIIGGAGDLYLTTSEKEALGGDGEAWAYDMAGGAA